MNLSDPDGLAALIRRRRMVRRFTADPVPAAEVAALVDLGRYTPSAGFTQGTSFLLLSDAQVDAFWTVSAEPGASNPWLDGMRTAPWLILVWTSEQAYRQRYAEPDKSAPGRGWDGEEQPWSAPYWWVDAGMAVQNVVLAATASGLGACFFGIPPQRQDAVRERFGVPAQQLSVGVIALGRPGDDGPSGSGRRRERRAYADQVRLGQWENR
ncbi:nitroreductase family protein [Granulicoccus phenolivorans]|uniref:nitroreductase family protein n=1 Tax=Granulicoccus phenolivorans TaxID=266854 RepID=UPI0004279529|nr:nitroreductase family protein [Granulicoccus phenolivorans]